MDIKLKRLELKNFKGIKKLAVDFGQETFIKGDNETGKTSIFDAFTWILFDKDSLGRSQFGIKTLDKDNNEIHGLDHQVIALLEVNGQELELQKTYYEKWTKKRGSAKKVWNGHTTDYFIDQVPVAKNEYDSKIAELVDENIFKLITDPRNFNEQLHWKERRELLIEVCGDITDQEVMSKDKDLKKLSKLLGNRDIEQHRKSVSAKMKNINKELEKIPVRIDEVSENIPDIEFDVSKVEDELKEHIDKQSRLREEISNIESGGQVAKLRQKVTELETQKQEILNELSRAKNEVVNELDSKIQQAKNKRSEIESELQSLNRNKQVAERYIDDISFGIKELKQRWYARNEEEFKHEVDEICPCCGQFLPAEELEKARSKALEQFNIDKSEALESINSEGKRLKANLEKYNKELEETTAKIKEVEVELKEAQEKVYELGSKRMKAINSNYPARDERVVKLSEKQKAIEVKIDNFMDERQEEIGKVKSKIDDLDMKINACQIKIAQKDSYDKAMARVEQLKDQEKKLAKEFENLDYELQLTEKFTRTKIELLTEKINSQFKMANFKMFDVQVNGGINECCETVYKGVTYSDLNNAARINVGIDIINTLTKFYDAQAPVFVDNRESITKLVDTDLQVVNLVVSDKHKKLKVEVK